MNHEIIKLLNDKIDVTCVQIDALAIIVKLNEELLYKLETYINVIDARLENEKKAIKILETRIENIEKFIVI